VFQSKKVKVKSKKYTKQGW